MNLGTRFNTLACLTVLFGLLMFCLADDRPGLAVLSVLVCILGWLAGGAAGGWRPVALPRLVVNLLVLATILNAAFRASRAGGGQPIVSHLGEFLVYIQLLKLFDRRTSRDESQLLTLSLFVVIAAMLTSNALPVGLCLVAYTPLAVATAMLFQVRAGQRRASAARAPGAAVEAEQLVPTSRLVAGRGASRQFRWLAGSSLVAAAAIAATIFVVTPRGLGAGALGRFGEGRGGTAATGFNERVELGQRGYLGDNTEPVLDMAIEDSTAVNIGSPDRVYYLRGVTRNRYQDSIWTAWTGDTMSVEVKPDADRATGEAPAEPVPLKVSSVETSDQLRTARLVQHITIRSPRGANPVLFAVWRPLAISSDSGMRLDVVRTDVSLRRNGTSAADLSYTVHSSPTDGDTGRRPRVPDAFAEGPIRELAVSLLRRAGVPIEPSQRDRPACRQAVNVFRAHLQDNFTYTREMVAPVQGQDPIEMFLFDTKRGHCEYFASAMVAMCQSVGIPARLVIGYVAADYNTVTGKYLVRQSNAHAWAEVYIGQPLPRPDSTQPATLAPPGSGTWQSVDPSPPGDVAAIHQAERGWMAAIRHWYETIEFGWNRSIIGFDAANQRSSALGRRLNLEAVDRFFDDVAGRLFVTAKQVGRPDGPAAWQNWVMPGLLAVVATVALVGRRRLAAGLSRLGRRDSGPRRLRIPALVDGGSGFYARALRLLNRAGSAKPTDTPPLAFARRLTAAGNPAGRALESLVSLYYKERFSSRRLTGDEERQAGWLVEELRASLRRR